MNPTPAQRPTENLTNQIQPHKSLQRPDAFRGSLKPLHDGRQDRQEFAEILAQLEIAMPPDEARRVIDCCEASDASRVCENLIGELRDVARCVDRAYSNGVAFNIESVKGFSLRTGFDKQTNMVAIAIISPTCGTSLIWTTPEFDEDRIQTLGRDVRALLRCYATIERRRKRELQDGGSER